MKGNTAKVTDFGMARLLSTFKSYDLIKCPGAAVYMPLEALCDPPDYDLKLIFSCGVLMIQIQTRKFPDPTNHYLIMNPNTNALESVNEIQRRACHIAECSDDNPLKHIALYCLADKKDRPSVDELCSEVMKLQQSSKYLENRVQGMQLVAKSNIPLMVQSYECQISKLQLQVTHLQESSEQKIQFLQQEYEKQIQKLQSEMIQLQQSGKQSHLESQLANNKQQVEKEFKQFLEQNNQVMVQHIQQIQLKFDEEKELLQRDKFHSKPGKMRSN